MPGKLELDYFADVLSFVSDELSESVSFFSSELLFPLITGGVPVGEEYLLGKLFVAN